MGRHKPSGNALCKKKIRTLGQKCVFGTKSTHFDIFFSALTEGQTLTHLEKKFQSALRVYNYITIDVNFKRTLKKENRRSKTFGTLFSFNRWDI